MRERLRSVKNDLGDACVRPSVRACVCVLGCVRGCVRACLRAWCGWVTGAWRGVA